MAQRIDSLPRKMSQNRIHCICLVKNEADIIEQCLIDASKWADRIYVYDGVSTDGTWEKVLKLAEEHEEIIAWKSENKVFSEGLRAEVFNAFKNDARPSDWWCQLNADEFFIDDPREFLSKQPSYPTVIWGTFAQYYITKTDLNNTTQNIQIVDPLNKLTYYEIIPTAEPRFFRHREGLFWDIKNAWPKHLGINDSRRIRLKHYPYRNTEQLKVRVQTRHSNIKRGFEGWSHLKDKDWSELLVDPKGLQKHALSEFPEFPEASLIFQTENSLIKMLKILLHKTKIWA